MDAPLHSYNNCLISCVLIGSFLSSLRVRTDKILIYASFQRSAVKVPTCKPMGFYWLSYVTNQKARKAMNNGRVILNKIHLALFTTSLRRLFPSFIPGIWPFSGLGIVEKATWRQFCMRLSCYWRNNFVVTLSSFTAEMLSCGSWSHSHFDIVMTQFIINKRADA